VAAQKLWQTITELTGLTLQALLNFH
jgi:hypothetical protein